jgi:hypothetical protein
MRHALIGLIGAAAVLFASTAMAQTARDLRGPAPVVPLATEPAPRIVIDPPLADSLVHGRVVIQYCAENLRIGRCSARRLWMCRRASGTSM